MKIHTIDVEFVIRANKEVCSLNRQNHICAHPEKIESALHSAFYPGSAPFVHGGVVDIGAAIFFYLIKAHAFFDGNKRTALIAATTFIGLNGWNLKYPISKSTNALAQVAEDCAASVVSLDELKKWFQTHKAKIIF